MVNRFYIAIIVVILAIANVANSQSIGNKLNSERNGPRFLPNVLIVKLSENVDIKKVDDFASRISTPSKYFGINSLDVAVQQSGGIKVEKMFPGSQKMVKPASPNSVSQTFYANKLEYYYRINLDGNTPLLRVKSKLEQDPNVEKVEFSQIYQEFAIPNDELYSGLQHLPQIKAEQAWNIHKGENGPEIVIGIHDSGVQWDHPDLFANLKINYNEWTNKNEELLIYENGRMIINPAAVDGLDSDGNGYADDVVGYNFVEWDNSPANDPYVTSINRHGTHVAGIASGVTNNSVGISSISWNVKFLATKHGSNMGGNSIYNVEQGLWYMAAAGVDVINMSWGGAAFSFMHADLFAFLRELDIILISAAGNGNNSEIYYPASYPGVFSVASVASNDQKTWYSNFSSSVDVAAPGGDHLVDGGINSSIPINSYGKLQGTSMACPLVAGLAGLIRSYKPNWTGQQVIRQISGTTDAIDALNPNYAGLLGSGRINAFRALSETNLNISQTPKLKIIELTYANQNGLNGIYPGDDVNIEILLRNFNQFVDAGAYVFKLQSSNPNITITNSNIVKYIKADDMLTIGGLTCNVKSDAKPEMINLNIVIQNLDGEVVLEQPLEFFIAGGILVYEFIPGSEHQSGTFIKEELTSKGFDVIYTNTFPTNLSGFKTVFLSIGSYLEEKDGSSFYLSDQERFAVFDYLVNGGKLFLDGSTAVTVEFIYWLPTELINMVLGLDDAYFDMEEVPFMTTYGMDGSLAEGMQFNNSTQRGDYIERYVPNPNYGGMGMLNMDETGIVGVQTHGVFGQKMVMMSFALAHYVDNDCPSTRSVLFDNIIAYLGLEKPLKINMPETFQTCQGSSSVVLTPGNSLDCATNTWKNETITGGSGNYSIIWSPQTNISNPNSWNPTVSNLINNTTYKLKVTDNVTGESKEITTLVKVSLAPALGTKLTVSEKVNTIRNINNYITNYSNANTYNWYRESIANPISASSALAWKVPMGTTRLFVEAVSESGCKSDLKRVIVFGSLLKDNDEVVEGISGASLMLAYPTVANDVLNVTAQFGLETDYSIKVVDLLGNNVLSTINGIGADYDGIINVNQLTSGTYLLVIETPSDKLIKKFVKM